MDRIKIAQLSRAVNRVGKRIETVQKKIDGKIKTAWSNNQLILQKKMAINDMKLLCEEILKESMSD